MNLRDVRFTTVTSELTMKDVSRVRRLVDQNLVDEERAEVMHMLGIAEPIEVALVVESAVA